MSIKSKHALYLNSLNEMQDSIAYAARKGTLIAVEEIILQQERRINELESHVANCKVNAEYAWQNVRILEKARVAAEEQVKELSSPMDLVRTVAIDSLELRVEEGYSFNGVQLPDELFNEIHAYVHEHKRPREFISAVIEMNMVKAINSCKYDIGVLQAVIGYFHNEATFACYGSKLKMELWLGGRMIR